MKKGNYPLYRLEIDHAPYKVTRTDFTSYQSAKRAFNKAKEAGCEYLQIAGILFDNKGEEKSERILDCWSMAL